MMTRFAGIFFLCALPFFGPSTFGQSNSGELRLKVTDPDGLGVRTTVQIVSEANQYRNTLATSDQGRLDVQRLPYGIYQVEIKQAGFAEISESVDIHSSIPIEYAIRLQLPSVKESVAVTAPNTLIDPDRPGYVSQIGSQLIQTRISSIPGRSVQDLVNSQPGWLYEGNAVLHPRGSEYQTQFVVDGIPLTDNRSPSFGPAMDADDIQSLSIYTGGIPAEYGRKMGGVVEVNTLQDSQPGFHGQVVLSGGSFDSAAAAAQGQYVWGKNIFGGSASGSMTDHYLNPVVPENFTNAGTSGVFSTNYERDLTPKDRLRFIVRRELARYEIPNELVQENPQLLPDVCPPGYTPGTCQPAPPPGTPSQLQTADNFETMGSASYQHIFSPNLLIDVRGMGRDNSNDFYSNPYSWPIVVFQHNDFKEAYFNTSISVHRGHQEWKAGIETDNIFLHENYSDIITANPNYSASYPFDPGTATTFAFAGTRPDLEQAAYVQDLIHFGNWTINAGLRSDHYQILLNQNAVSPRFAIAYYFPKAGLMVHFSYDRIFQTPSFENILLSSSSQVQSFEPNVLRLPVEPSHGNYFEWGASKSFFGQFRFDANIFRRAVNNYADDDQILNTSISFPLSFERASLYGAEGKLELPHWKGFSGFISESYIVGNAWYPVTGGLLIGVSDTCVSQPEGVTCPPLSGHFPDSQDQRHSVRGRLRYQVQPRFWIAGGIQYDTGLPFQIDTSEQAALAEYGQQVIDRINFARGRINPSFQVNASAGADLYQSDHLKTRLQVDGQNLTNVLDIIDFGGLFSGNAIGPSRSVALRLTTAF